MIVGVFKLQENNYSLSLVVRSCIISSDHLMGFSLFLKSLFIFRERGREGEIEERNINMWLPLKHPLLGTWPTTQANALPGNQTSNPLVCRPALNPLSHTSQGGFNLLKKLYMKEFYEVIETKFNKIIK